MHSWPVLVHYCDACSYNTPVEYSGTVWTKEHNCNYCGSKSKGADIAGESKGAMNSAQHDELAELFAQNMQLSHQQQQQQQAQQEQLQSSLNEPAPLSFPEKVDSPVHFASAHYTQTAHLRSETRSEPSRSPPPPYHVALMPEAMAETLRQNSIDPSSLLPNQIDLFLNADYEQRLRLLELWRISPPSYPVEKHAQVMLHWTPTSVEREERGARERYEKQMSARVVPVEEHMLDTHIVEPSIDLGRQQTEAEPYIVNGYEIASNKHSVDPVYASGLWTAPSYARGTSQQQPSSMEDQYGMYEQIRNHADWERMNEQLAREKLLSLQSPGSVDDEMIM